MPEKRWKRSEREIAEIVGGKRVPITGRIGSDIDHKTLALEVKTREQIPKWLTQAVNQAQAGAAKNHLPMVVLHKVGDHHPNDLVIIKLSDFIKWFGDLDAITPQT